MKTYPIFLVGMESARCVVIGGGHVAARKASALLEANARVVIISPSLCERLRRLAIRGQVDVIDRDYCTGDLEEAFLVIAATDDPAVNQRVWREADARGLLINTVDDPEHCNFIAPSVVRQGALTLAISTSGRCPALSRHLRLQLEQDFGPAYADYVELLGELRESTVDTLSLEERRSFWRQIFNSDVLSLLASGRKADARRRAQAILTESVAGGT